jgi:hypothetical protein
MTKLMAGMVMGMALVVGVGMASANTCPILVKQLRDELPNVKDKAKHDQAMKLTDECEKLHKDGKHDESVKRCEEAAKAAGISLKRM